MKLEASVLTPAGNLPLGRSWRLPNNTRTLHPGARQGVEKDD
jgi:hypothetical protein